MGGCFSRLKMPGKVFTYLSAIANSLRLGWLGVSSGRTEMKTCQIAIFPNLMNVSAVDGDCSAMEIHIREGAEVTCGDERGRTALHVAAGEGWENAVHFLLLSGAYSNATDRDGVTPLRDAIRSKNLDVVALLVSAGARWENSSEELGAEMCYLAHLGQEEEMELWLKAGISINVQDAHGRTPLHVAVCSNQPEMVKFCISNGSDLERRDRLNNRPVDDAQRLDLQHMVELLEELTTLGGAVDVADVDAAVDVADVDAAMLS